MLKHDPVCGMTVNAETTPDQASYQGQTYYFCCAGCRTKFIADPQRYLDKRSAARVAPAAAIYTCPMHPEIRQAGPGACPICGMALEPETGGGNDRELADMTRRLWISLALALPVVGDRDGRPPRRDALDRQHR